MGTEAPTPVVIPVHCAPKKAPCPESGTRGRRKRTLTRTVRTVASKTIAVLEITYGEYAARCDCCTTFRNTSEGVLKKAKYDNKVRDLVLDRILRDGLNIEWTLESIRRDFLLDLSSGFVSDVLRDQVRQLDTAEHRNQVLKHFSGTLCVDELHLGRFTLLLATDPLSDLPVGFALVSANDQDHLRRFLRNLKNWGLAPKVVVTDGSNLYPSVLGELWPEADHQLCVFHVLKDINKLILDAVRRMRREMGRRGKAGRNDSDAGILPRVGDAAAVRRPDLLAVRHAEGLSSGGVPSGRDCPRPGVPGCARVGQGDRATGPGEVCQVDGVPEEPFESPGADQQPCGADQPDVPLPGEGEIQVATSEGVGAVRGADTGRDLEGMDSGRGEEHQSHEACQA
jgi:hypothetical protein